MSDSWKIFTKNLNREKSNFHVASSATPEIFASKLLSCLGLRPPFWIEEMARELGLEIRSGNTTGFEGTLVRNPHGAGGIIATGGGVRGFSRQRFTIAHEIGHYVLSTDQENTVCLSRDLQLWNPSIITEERAANRFAAELLLPAKQVAPIVIDRGVSIETANYVKNSFNTSLTTAAFRCAELSFETCAVVCIVDGIVKSYLPSKSWGYRIFTGCPLSKSTMAAELIENRSTLTRCGRVNAMAWADASKFMDLGAELFEDSIHLRRFKIILTLLTEVG
jgi:hypothetical protein